MKTTIHYYRFDISDANQAVEHRSLMTELDDGRRFFNVWGDRKREDQTDREITLEANCLFDNQWNTSCGLRVFDHYEGIYHSRSIKAGHYLDITPEMEELRRNTLKCRYCGNMETAAKGLIFCPKCLGSEYLTEGQIELTRLMRVDDRSDCPELTDQEHDRLLPLYIEAQTRCGNSRRNKRIKEQRAELSSEYTDAVENALAKRDGFLWLLGNGINTGNCIYYKHTGRFCFGWRQKMSEGVKSELLDLLREFPFDYDFE